MEAKFIGDPANGGQGPGTITIQGVTFTYDKWMKVDPGSALARKLQGSNHFETREPRPALAKAADKPD